MDNNLNQEKTCIVFGILSNEDKNTFISFEEIKELTRTLGLKILDTLSQNVKIINSAIYIGSGKLEELKILCDNLKPDFVVIDCDLSPVQQRNIEKELNTYILDRTNLILEIFAKRASSKEGKIQVELAKLNYLQTRLVGYGVELSRLAGGIGTRGPGESKLETDKRRIKEKIVQLKNELSNVIKQRQTTSKLRNKNQMPQIAIVGYTNAGKSTLLNTLTDANTFVEDKLFATLDTTTRKLILKDKKTALITDTVGFIRNLPHHLLESFKSTFEGINDADLILHVINLNDENFPSQIDNVFKVLEDLNITDIPILNVYNKVDTVEDIKTVFLKNIKINPSINISALKNINIEALKEKINEILSAMWFTIDIDLNKTETDKIQNLIKLGKIISSDENKITFEFQKKLENKVLKIIS